MHNDTLVDVSKGTFTGRCSGFWEQPSNPAVKPGIYTGDFNLGVLNSTGESQYVDTDHFFCGGTLASWQNHTNGQDMHSRVCTNANGECGVAAMLAKARAMLWEGQ
jgi:hypothetical protein